MRTLALTLVGVTAATPLVHPAVAQPTDTTKVSTDPLFTVRDLWIASGFVLTTVALYPADRALAGEIQRDPLQDNHFLKESADFFDFMGTKGSVYILGRGFGAEDDYRSFPSGHAGMAFAAAAAAVTSETSK